VKQKETLLRIEKLCVDFKTREGSVRVLDNIDFHLAAGESIGIVGESGCGKSMTAFSIMGLVPTPAGIISNGSIFLNDSDLLKISEKEMQDIRGNRISMIFQEPMTSLNPVFTVGNQISESIKRHQQTSAREARRKTLDMLRAVNIPAPEQRLCQYPYELSGGMRQRIMIAMALSCQPSVLIADEPTTALDVTVQAQIFDLLRAIQKDMGTAIILITHDMGVIAEFAERVIVMYAGRKVEEGAINEIIKNPYHPYTRGLLKCVPHLKVDPGEKREELAEIPGFVPDLSKLGKGCHFASRCDFAIEKCFKDTPIDEQVIPNHYVSCWRSGDIQ
jgi:oligopeptide/dipeptide ABC transporter ATP-binding protein